MTRTRIDFARALPAPWICRHCRRRLWFYDISPTTRRRAVLIDGRGSQRCGTLSLRRHEMTRGQTK